MNISTDFQGRIANEIEYVLDRMEEAATPRQELYYFSAVHGIINRLMNFECDPVLVFAHHVLSTTHSSFVSQLGPIEERPNGPEVFGKLLAEVKLALAKLPSAIKSNNDGEIYDVLKQFANIAYALTGNGYYLYTRGMLKLEQAE
jgi:hypothetical protein